MRINNISLIVFLSLSLFQFIVAQEIFNAVENGDIEEIKSLLQEYPEKINERDSISGLTPLHQATLNGRLKICELLIEYDADLDYRDGDGGTVLHVAAYGDQQDLIEIFINAGIDPNVQDNNGYTPIVWAISGKSVTSMDLLLKNGADLHPPIRIGRSLLHFAGANGDTVAIAYLLKNKVNINSKSNYGNTPLLWAMRAKKYDNVRYLIKKGANLDIMNNEGLSPIIFAVRNNDTILVNILFANGINIKKQNKYGDTHLHTAAYNGNKEMVSLLLTKGVDPNIINDQGVTALDLAIRQNHKVVKGLLESEGAHHGKDGELNTNQNRIIKYPGDGLSGPIKISIIYDNYKHKENIEADWGFSCYIEGSKKNILFDTGTKKDLFLDNLFKSHIEPKEIEIVIISHEHGDHTGGLFSLLELNNQISVFLPYSFSYDFVRRVESLDSKVILIKDPSEVCEDIYLSGELNARMINEQSMAINTEKGLVVIAGCSHPGITKIVKKFKDTLNKNIYMVLGGFHLMNHSDQEVKEIIDQLKELGVEKCGASHCTGSHQIQLIKEAFGTDFITLGTGREIIIIQ